MPGIVKFIVFCQFSLRRTCDEPIHNKSHKRINIQKYKLLKFSNCWQHILHLSMLLSSDTTWKERLFAITSIVTTHFEKLRTEKKFQSALNLGPSQRNLKKNYFFFKVR